MSEPDFSPRLYRVCRDSLRLMLLLYNRLEVRGREHVPAEGGCIIAANHASFLDPPIVGSGANHRIVRFMARDTLFRHPMWNRLLLGVAAVPLSRERGDVGALRKAIQVLKQGACLGLFPEGTRSPDGELRDAKGGIGFLIAKAGVPVVPAYIQGSFAAYPRQARWIRPRKVRITFGPPIVPAEFESLGSGRESYEQIGKLVMDRIKALRPSEST